MRTWRKLTGVAPGKLPPITPETHPMILWWCHRCEVSGHGPTCWFCGRADKLNLSPPLPHHATG